MKKSYLMIAAAALVFAACSKESLVNDPQPKQEKQTAIGFTSYSEKSTRGDQSVATNLEYYHESFAVYGTKIDADNDIQVVFGAAAATSAGDGTECDYQTTEDATLGDWKYDDPRFWDKAADYSFVAYAPVSASNPIRYNLVADTEVGDAGNSFVASTYTLVGDNLQDTPTTAEIVTGFSSDIDIMTSEVNDQSGATHDDYVNLVFHHILAKLNVTFAKASVLDNATVTITDVKITGLNDTGDYDEDDYDATANPKVSGWSASSTDDDYALANDTDQELNDSDDDPYYMIESLVMPQTVPSTSKLVVKYTIESGSYSEDYKYTMDFDDAFANFYDRCNYTLKFTISPDIIKFDATVTEWADQTAKSITITE